MKLPRIALCWLIWGFLVFNVAVYSALVASGAVSRSERPIDPSMTNVFLVVAGSTMAFTFVLRFLFRHLVKREGAAALQSAAVERLMLTFGIVIWALCEAIAIYGLVLFFGSSGFIVGKD